MKTQDILNDIERSTSAYPLSSAMYGARRTPIIKVADISNRISKIGAEINRLEVTLNIKYSARCLEFMSQSQRDMHRNNINSRLAELRVEHVNLKRKLKEARRNADALIAGVVDPDDGHSLLIHCQKTLKSIIKRSGPELLTQKELKLMDVIQRYLVNNVEFESETQA